MKRQVALPARSGIWLRIRFVVLLTVAVVLAGGCGTPPMAPVEERMAAPPRQINHHIVAPGETLYSIAWRYGLDFRVLAQLNRVDRRHTIRVGQRLALTPGAQSTHPGTPLAGPSRQQSPVRPSAPQPGPSVGRLQWRWPAPGPVVQRFGAGRVPHKGIDIRGELGEPVAVSAAGTVVYAGSGLVGYGNLVIVKHNDRYLSAYGHNNRLWVVEGQQVKGGDRIADIGDSGTDSTVLHFEIRLDGKPVDPVSLLPRRP